MLILLHVIIALSSIVWTSLLFFYPSKRRLYTSYVLVGLTLGSGTYLVLSTHSRMLPACTMGLAYSTAMIVGIAAARRKLISATDNTDKTE